MRRRTILLLATMVVALVLASGVALAANPINCADDTVAPCEGTTADDEMTGTSNTDHIYAKEGNDTLRGLERFDDLRSAGDPATTTSMEEPATTSAISMRITGDWTASQATSPDQRTG